MKNQSLFNVIVLTIFAIEQSLQSCQLDGVGKDVFIPSVGYNFSTQGMKCDDIEDIMSQNSVFYIPGGKQIYTNYRRIDDIAIYGVSILSSPSYIGTFPPKIKYILTLSIEHTDLEELDTNCMRVFLNLEEVHMSHNKIRKIETELLTSTRYLKILDFSYNRIASLNKNCFKNNVNLTTVLLNNNDISKIDGQIFSSLRSLQLLDLSYNQINSIDEDCFANNYNLTKLSLNNNNIHNLPNLPSLNHMYYLNISNNPIQDSVYSESNYLIGGGSALSHLDNLIFLDISNISLENDNIRILKNNKNIQVLDVSTNNLTKVTEVMFGYLTKLKELDLSHNSIISVEVRSFYDMYELRKVNLNANQLTSLPKGLFLFQKHLEYLDISNNPMKDGPIPFLGELTGMKELYLNGIGINESDLMGNIKKMVNVSRVSTNNNYLIKVIPEMFSNLSYLTYLDISSNSISYLHKDAFSGLYRLQYLRIQNNQIESLPSMLFRDTKLLTYLDVSNNKLGNLPIGIFENSPNLLTLNLSFNDLEYLSQYTTYRLKNLKELFIQNNRISKIEGANYLRSLTTVSLKNNPWTCKELFDFFQIFDDGLYNGLDANISSISNQTALDHVRYISCDSSQPSSNFSPSKIPKDSTASSTNPPYAPQENSLLKDLRNLFEEFRQNKNITVNSDASDFREKEFKFLNDININLKNVLEEFRISQTSRNIASPEFNHSSEQENKLLTDINNNLRNILQKLDKDKLTAEYDSTLASNYNKSNNINIFKFYKTESGKSQDNYNQNLTSPLLHISEESQKQMLRMSEQNGNQMKTSDYLSLFVGICLICVACVLIYRMWRKQRMLSQRKEELLLETRM